MRLTHERRVINIARTFSLIRNIRNWIQSNRGVVKLAIYIFFWRQSFLAGVYHMVVGI